MNKPRHPVDEFFSEVLKNYKVIPTEAARNAFLTEAEGIERTIPGYKTRKRWVIITFSGIILLTCITAIFISRKTDTGIPGPVHKYKVASYIKRDYHLTEKNSSGLISGQSIPNSHPGNTQSTAIDRSAWRKASSKIPNLVQSNENNISN